MQTTLTLVCQKAADTASFLVDLDRRFRGVTDVYVNWARLMNTSSGDLGCVLLHMAPLVFDTYGLYGHSAAGADYHGFGHGMLVIPTDGTTTSTIVKYDPVVPKHAICSGGILSGQLRIAVFDATGAAASLDFVVIDMTIGHSGYA